MKDTLTFLKAFFKEDAPILVKGAFITALVLTVVISLSMILVSRIAQ